MDSEVMQAVHSATAYTHLGIETAERKLGAGHGPLNHMHNLTKVIIPKPTASNPHPFTRRLIQDNLSMWKEYVEHDFVVQLARGTLPLPSFLHFIKYVRRFDVQAVLLMRLPGRTTITLSTTRGRTVSSLPSRRHSQPSPPRHRRS